MWESISTQPTFTFTSDLQTKDNAQVLNSTSGFEANSKKELAGFQQGLSTYLPAELSTSLSPTYNTEIFHLDNDVDHIDSLHYYLNLSNDETSSEQEIVTISFEGLYNESLWFPNGSSSYDDDESLLKEGHYNWGVLSLTILILATMIGNILVCLAVCWEKRLQNMTNYFLMSLAMADLLVSMLVMPLGMVVEFFGNVENLFTIFSQSAPLILSPFSTV